MAGALTLTEVAKAGFRYTGLGRGHLGYTK